MNDWYLRHESGKRFQVVNNTGGDALDVEMHLEGAAVAGMFASSKWRLTLEEVPAGDGPSEVFAQGWGPDGYVVVAWSTPAGERRSTRVALR